MKTALVIGAVAAAAYVVYRIATAKPCTDCTGTVAGAGSYGNSVGAALGAR